MIVRRVLGVSSERIRTFARQQVQIHAKQLDAGARIVRTEVRFGAERKGLGSHRDGLQRDSSSGCRREAK